MNKPLKVAMIIVASLLLSAVIIMLVRFFSGLPEPAPEFVYTSTSATAVTTTTTASTTQSSAMIQTTPTTSTPEESHPIVVEEIVLLTSNDPENYFELTFDEDTIYIKGQYNGEKVASFTAGVGYAEPEYSDDTYFTAELTPYLDQEYHSIIAVLDNGSALHWRIQKYDNGSCPVICEEVAEQNIKANEHILDIPTDIVADYIVTGGTEEQRTEVLAEISVIAEQVCEGMESDYDKARALSQWVSQNIYYDFDAYLSSVTTETLSLESTLSLHRSVCGGYANLYAALCQSQGIECYITQGDVVQNHRTFAETDDEAPSHEWNLVCIDGRYFWVDTLWNSSGNIYIDGQYSEGSPSLRYFDPTEEVMSQDHRAKRIERRAFFN